MQRANILTPLLITAALVVAGVPGLAAQDPADEATQAVDEMAEEIATEAQTEVDPETVESAGAEAVQEMSEQEMSEDDAIETSDEADEAEMVEPETVAAMADEDIVLMSARWAELACEAWNAQPTLTDELAAPGWAADNADRGYKIIQLYRTDCEDAPWVEVQISDQDGKALCTYGRPTTTEELASGVDYVMHATTDRWLEMGAGDYGPMKGMITGRLKFQGPKWEAMKNMGPFTSFLRLVGEVDASAETCAQPAAP